jgi:hypothetical protein
MHGNAHNGFMLIETPKIPQIHRLANRRGEPVSTPKMPPTPSPSPRFYENNRVARYSEKHPLKTNNLKLALCRKSTVLGAKAAILSTDEAILSVNVISPTLHPIALFLACLATCTALARLIV